MPRVANLILLLVAAVVPIAGAEVLLRAVAPLSLDEEVEFTQTLPGVKETVVYERDRLGLRRPDRDTWEEDGTLRILCVGGSTAEQVPQSFPDTWCGSLASTLEQTLEAQGERTAVRAAIFGRGGFRAVDVLDWVSRNLDEVQPDLVVALLGVNDLVWNGGSSYQYGAWSGRSRPVESAGRRIFP